MEHYDVAVIGAGPAGSMASKYAALSGSKTVLLEEHFSVGWPVQCAGLLGIKAIKESELKGESFAIRKVCGATVYSPGGDRLSISSQEDKAWVVDRRLFDRALLNQAIKSGVDFRLNSQVTKIFWDGKRNLLVVGDGKGEFQQISSKVIISTEGVKAKMARSRGICPPKEMLSSAQVEAPFQVGDLNKVEIHLGGELAPGFFAWMIPAQNGAARIGLSCWGNACTYLRKFLKSKPIKSRLKGGPVNLVVGGLPLGPSQSTVVDGLMAVGDTAGQVKPTSGGGIYPGLICAKIAGQVAAAAAQEDDSSALRLAEYDRRWKASIGRELNLGMKVHQMLNMMTDQEQNQLIKHLTDKKNLIDIIERYGDVDRPSVAIKKIAPRLSLSDLKTAKIFWRLYRATTNWP